MTVKVEDKRLFAPDGTPIELTPPRAEPSAPQAGGDSASAHPEALPPVRFPDLVFLLGAQAGMCMGGPPPGATGPAPPPDLEAARHFIDLLEVLADKTRGNLTVEEDGMLVYNPELQTLRAHVDGQWVSIVLRS